MTHVLVARLALLFDDVAERLRQLRERQRDLIETDRARQRSVLPDRVGSQLTADIAGDV